MPSVAPVLALLALFLLGAFLVVAAAILARRWIERRWGTARPFLAVLAFAGWGASGLCAAAITAGTTPGGDIALALTVASLCAAFAVANTAAFVVVHRRTRAESAVLATRFPVEDRGHRHGRFILDDQAIDLQIRYDLGAGPRRVLDGRRLLLTCRVAPAELTLERPPRLFGRWPEADRTALSRTWLTPEVTELVRRDPGVVVRAGVVELRTAAWLTPAGLDASLARLGPLVLTMRAAARGAPGRASRLALTAEDPAVRRRAWADLDEFYSAAGAEIADNGAADPDPLIRVLAARWLPDRAPALIADVLRSAEDPVALALAAEWCERRHRAELAGALAARLGIPPEGAWPSIARALGVLGGRPELEALHLVRAGEGYPAPLRRAAAQAITAIRARLGGEDASGRLALPEGVGGEVALAGGGELGDAERKPEP